MKTLLAAIFVLSWASIPTAAQDAARDKFQASMVKGKVQVEGNLDLPDEAIVDVIVERSMNEANFANPILRPIRSDMPVRQWVEVKKGEFKATFSHPICAGYYFVRIEFLTKFQRSNKVGQALTKGTLKEFSVERKVFLGTTEELLEGIRQSIAPAEALSKKILDAIEALNDPKAEMAQVASRFDRISDEIDRLRPTTSLPATLHALKGQAETLSTRARGTASKKNTSGNEGGGAPPLRRPPQGGGGGQDPNQEPGDKGGPGNEEGFLKPSDNPVHGQEGIKLGDRFGKGKTMTGSANESSNEPTSRAKERASLIHKLISREIAVLLLERSQDLTETFRRTNDAGLEAQLQKLSDFHASRAALADEVGQMYQAVTKVETWVLAKYFEKTIKFVGPSRPAPGPELDALSREIEDLWPKFDQTIRNRP